MKHLSQHRENRIHRVGTDIYLTRLRLTDPTPGKLFGRLGSDNPR